MVARWLRPSKNARIQPPIAITLAETVPLRALLRDYCEVWPTTHCAVTLTDEQVLNDVGEEQLLRRVRAVMVAGHMGCLYVHRPVRDSIACPHCKKLEQQLGLGTGCTNESAMRSWEGWRNVHVEKVLARDDATCLQGGCMMLTLQTEDIARWSAAAVGSGRLPSDDPTVIARLPLPSHRKVTPTSLKLLGTPVPGRADAIDTYSGRSNFPSASLHTIGSLRRRYAPVPSNALFSAAAASELVVAVHVQRRDLLYERGRPARWHWVRDSYYETMLPKLAKQLAQAHTSAHWHVFSEGRAAWSKLQPQWTRHLASAGATSVHFHIDEAPCVVLDHMASADVLITSPSALATVAVAYHIGVQLAVSQRPQLDFRDCPLRQPRNCTCDLGLQTSQQMPRLGRPLTALFSHATAHGCHLACKQSEEREERKRDDCGTVVREQVAMLLRWKQERQNQSTAWWPAASLLGEAEPTGRPLATPTVAPRSRTARGMIAYLAQVRHSSYGRNSMKLLIRSLRSLHHFYNQKQSDDVIIFHNGDFTPEHQRTITSDLHLRGAPISFRQPRDEHWQMPSRWVNRTPFETWRGSSSYSVGYRHMIRFFSICLWDEAAFLGYSHVMRMDEESVLLSPVHYNIFDFMQSNSIVYGYRQMARESGYTVEALHTFVRTFLQQQQITPTWLFDSCKSGWRLQHARKPFSVADFTLRNCGTIRGFYNNWFASDVSFWRRPDVRSFLQYVDSSGLIYTERWNDILWHSIGVQTFARVEQVHLFEDFSYEHLSERMDAAPRSRGKRAGSSNSRGVSTCGFYGGLAIGTLDPAPLQELCGRTVAFLRRVCQSRKWCVQLRPANGTLFPSSITATAHVTVERPRQMANARYVSIRHPDFSGWMQGQWKQPSVINRVCSKVPGDDGRRPFAPWSYEDCMALPPGSESHGASAVNSFAAPFGFSFLNEVSLSASEKGTGRMGMEKVAARHSERPL